MAKINLLYIIEGGGPGGAGGAERNLLTIIRAIDKTQYEIRVSLLHPSDILERELKTLNIPPFILNMTGKWDIFSIFRLARFMRREKIDIVHSCLYFPNAVGRIAAILAGVPVIIAWEQGEVLKQKPARHCKVDKILAKFTDAIVACSKTAKEGIIKKEGIPEHKIRVIYNCVDLARFNASSDASAIKKQLGIKADEILIGTVATLNKIKGQEYLIRAMPQIIKVYPKIKLLLVGQGPSKPDFVQIIKNMNIRDKVIFTGFRRDIPEITNALDIYVCPSIYEALGISTIQAMSLKKPVVATRVGGIHEVVIENQTGYLVPPKDVDSVAQAIISTLANRERMRRMGEAGLERVKKNFSSELIIKEIEALYKELSWKIHTESQ